ncbi:MAG: hypothetical protein ETSY1_14170 [Candidatus Entotheonella factor]|uniref:Uncharacterized protein n=1 Tax=Entotheonella factor TaxID=1429438 RepID=W4LPI6_ENTF1|nr:MAG: hypothetical protein ETSY1_14170 [Candidatus Entotheonella factor]
MLGFQSFESAQSILTGIELMYMLRTGILKMRASWASR